MRRAVLLLVGAAVCASAPDLQGLELDTVYGLSADGHVHKLINGEAHRRRRRLLETVETASVVKGKFDGNRRDLVRIFAALESLSYGPGKGTANGAEMQSGVSVQAFSPEQIRPIFDAGDQNTIPTNGKKYTVNVTQQVAYPQVRTGADELPRAAQAQKKAPRAHAGARPPPALLPHRPQFWESYRAAYNENGQKLNFQQTPDVPAGEAFKCAL
jgi:imidazolonepropionase-like amidohydrolase